MRHLLIPDFKKHFLTINRTNMKYLTSTMLLFILALQISFAQTSSVSGQLGTGVGILSGNPIFTAVLTNVQTAERQTILLTQPEFKFNNIANGYDYTLTIEQKNDIYNVLNGISTLDLVLIQRHILGMQPMQSELMRIAADVNGDKYISVYDMVLLRKLILGISSTLPESWRIRNKIDLSQHAIQIVKLFEDVNNADFVLIKVGDINGNSY